MIFTKNRDVFIYMFEWMFLAQAFANLSLDMWTLVAHIHWEY